MQKALIVLGIVVLIASGALLFTAGPKGVDESKPGESPKEGQGLGPETKNVQKEITGTYHFVPNPLNSITFEGKTDLLTISGTTKQIEGIAANVDGKRTAELKVPVASLDTGYGPINDVIQRPEWLDSEKHPNLVFKATKAEPIGKTNTRWKIEGDFSMRGVAQKVSFVADIKRVPDVVKEMAGLEGDWIRVRASFKLSLKASKIEIPAGSVAQVGDEWTVSITLFGANPKPRALDPCKKSHLKVEDDKDKDDKDKPEKILLPETVAGERFRFGQYARITTVTASAKSVFGSMVSVQTKKLGGQMAVDLEKGTGKVKLRVPVDSLCPGFVKSCDLLQGETLLNVKKHPFILFESTKVSLSGVVLTEKGKLASATCEVEGNLSMLGKTKKVSATIPLEGVSSRVMFDNRCGRKMGIKCPFSIEVRLTDFGVTQDAIAAAWLGNVWTVKFDVTAAGE